MTGFRGQREWKATAASVAVMCWMSTVTAQQPAILTLDAAVEQALVSNPAIIAARLSVVASRAGVAVARERLNPEVSVELERETPKQAFSVAVPLELGDKRTKRIAVSEATVRAGEAELEVAIARVRSDVRRAYVSVVMGGSRLDLLRDLRDLTARARDTAQARVDAGDAPRLEVLQASLAVAAAENETALAEGDVRAARTRLNALIGQPLSTTHRLSVPDETTRVLTLDDALRLVETRNAEGTALDRRIDEQRARLRLARSLRVPDVTPTASITRESQPDFQYGWRAGVAMTVPLFTTHAAGVTVEQTILDQLNAERQTLSARLTAEVTAASIVAETRRDAYARYRDQILPGALEVEGLAEDAYRLGQTGMVARLQSLQITRDIRLRSQDALAQLYSAVADLEQSIGATRP